MSKVIVSDERLAEIKAEQARVKHTAAVAAMAKVANAR